MKPPAKGIIMEYKIEEIAPEGFTATIDGKNLTFGVFTWADAIYFEKTYGKESILVLIARNPEEMTSVLAWRLLKEKELFGTIEKFVESFSPKSIKVAGLSDKLMATLGICVSKVEVKKSKDKRFCGNRRTGIKAGGTTNIFKQIFRFFGFNSFKHDTKADTNKTI